MPSLPTESGRPPHGRRRWFLLLTALLVAVGVGVIRLQPELERNLKDWFTVAILTLGLALTLIWFAFLSRFPWRVRLIAIGAFGLASLGLRLAVRVDGTISSVGFPRLAWKWTAPRQPLREVPARPASASVPNSTMPDAPQFFGPKRDGVVTGAKLARDWISMPPRELWRQPVGAGWSAFAVAGGRALTQEQRGERESLTCYEVLSGKVLWSLDHAARFFQWQAGEGPHATPTVDRGLVFAYGATGILECVEAATGNRVWSREVLKENQLVNLDWGVSASPLVVDDAVIVTGGNTRSSTVLAYHRTTGAPLWRSGTDRASYSSPVLATIAGRRLVLSYNAATLTALEPETGAVRLSHAWSEEKIPKAAQPVVLAGDRVFLSAGYGAGCVMLQLAAGPGDQLSATPRWKNLRMKNQFNSVAVREGYLYGLDDGLLACVDAQSGERKWKDGRYGSGQTLLVDDLIIIQSEPGPVALAEAKPDGFRELGSIAALSSKTWNHPTLAGRYLLVRNDREAVCYELPVEKNAAGP